MCSSDRKGRALRWLAVAAASLALPACVTTSATQVLLYESSPVVQHYEEMRTKLVERDQAGGGSIKKGGCPVCAW